MAKAGNVLSGTFASVVAGTVFFVSTTGVVGLSIVGTSPGRRGTTGRAVIALVVAGAADSTRGGGRGPAVVAVTVTGADGASGAASRTESGTTPCGRTPSWPNVCPGAVENDAGKEAEG